MQFSVIRTYCALRFRDVGNNVVTDASWKLYVNSAYGDVLQALPFFPWNELSTTLTYSASTRSQNLPTDAWQVLSVFNATDVWPMVELEGRENFLNLYPIQTEIGSPLHYRLFNNALQIYPLPQGSTALTVEYVAMPADLSADADLPVFPEQFHDLLVVGAVARAYRDDGNNEQASAYENEFAQMLKPLVVNMGQPRNPRFVEMTDPGWR